MQSSTSLQVQDADSDAAAAERAAGRNSGSAAGTGFRESQTSASTGYSTGSEMPNSNQQQQQQISPDKFYLYGQHPDDSAAAYLHSALARSLPSSMSGVPANSPLFNLQQMLAAAVAARSQHTGRYMDPADMYAVVGAMPVPSSMHAGAHLQAARLSAPTNLSMFTPRAMVPQAAPAAPASSDRQFKTEDNTRMDHVLQSLQAGHGINVASYIGPDGAGSSMAPPHSFNAYTASTWSPDGLFTARSITSDTSQAVTTVSASNDSGTQQQINVSSGAPAASVPSEAPSGGGSAADSTGKLNRSRDSDRATASTDTVIVAAPPPPQPQPASSDVSSSPMPRYSTLGTDLSHLQTGGGSGNYTVRTESVVSGPPALSLFRRLASDNSSVSHFHNPSSAQTPVAPFSRSVSTQSERELAMSPALQTHGLSSGHQQQQGDRSAQSAHTGIAADTVSPAHMVLANYLLSSHAYGGPPLAVNSRLTAQSAFPAYGYSAMAGSDMSAMSQHQPAAAAHQPAPFAMDRGAATISSNHTALSSGLPSFSMLYNRELMQQQQQQQQQAPAAGLPTRTPHDAGLNWAAGAYGMQSAMQAPAPSAAPPQMGGARHEQQQQQQQQQQVGALSSIDQADVLQYLHVMAQQVQNQLLQQQHQQLQQQQQHQAFWPAAMPSTALSMFAPSMQLPPPLTVPDGNRMTAPFHYPAVPAAVSSRSDNLHDASVRSSSIHDRDEDGLLSPSLSAPGITAGLIPSLSAADSAYRKRQAVAMERARLLSRLADLKEAMHTPEATQYEALGIAIGRLKSYQQQVDELTVRVKGQKQLRSAGVKDDTSPTTRRKSSDSKGTDPQRIMIPASAASTAAQLHSAAVKALNADRPPDSSTGSGLASRRIPLRISDLVHTSLGADDTGLPRAASQLGPTGSNRPSTVAACSAFFTYLFRDAFCGRLLVNGDARIVDVNDQLARDIGFRDRFDLLARCTSIADLVHPRVLEDFVRNMALTLAGECVLLANVPVRKYTERAAPSSGPTAMSHTGSTGAAAAASSGGGLLMAPPLPPAHLAAQANVNAGSNDMQVDGPLISAAPRTPETVVLSPEPLDFFTWCAFNARVSSAAAVASGIQLPVLIDCVVFKSVTSAVQ